jgi:hypothetical protein
MPNSSSLELCTVDYIFMPAENEAQSGYTSRTEARTNIVDAAHQVRPECLSREQSLRVPHGSAGIFSRYDFIVAK